MVHNEPISVIGHILTDKSPRLGTEVVVTLSGDKAHEDTYYEVMLHANAVFDEEYVSEAPHEAWFVGMLVDGKQWKQVWEHPSQPGKLMIISGPRLTNIFCLADDQNMGLTTLPWKQCGNTARWFADYQNRAVDVCLQVTQGGGRWRG